MKIFTNKTPSIFIFYLILIISFQAKAQTIPTLEDRVDSLLSKMTLDEKILQLHKEGNFNTATNTRLGIPGFIMADGPHGVRDGSATAFPVGIGMAATWDVDLAQRVGRAMGEEFWGKGKHQALGPCLDLTRDPRNGRSPESGGEDPFLDAQITTSVILGIQTSPVIATAKHYNGVFRQDGRTDNNYIVSQRNLLEHYGFNFRNAVQVGGVMSVMNAYNLINGDKCGESTNLLKNILKTKWGFPYYVVSDWCSLWDAQKAITAGCDLEMCSDLYATNLKNLVQNNSVPESVIDESVKRVLRTKIMNEMMDHYPAGDPSLINNTTHQQLALEAGEKSIVLLKNLNNILPFDKDSISKIAVVGPSADILQIDGSGSSYVTPFYTVTPKQGIENIIGADKVLYAKGCNISGSNASDVGTALQYAADADVVIFVGGLDQSQEGEGFDRANGSIELPQIQKDFINYLYEKNHNLIVVLFSGGICSVHPFIDKVKGLLYAFYPGQEGGNAIAKIIFGEYNPAGRLPVTMPVSDSQLPDRNFNFDDDFGGGYRWFDNQGLTPEFAFGFGLSYTTFEYSNLVITPTQTEVGKTVEVSCDVKNTGSIEGEEVAQLYLSANNHSITFPKKQLKGFKRISLQPGETKTINFNLTANELYYFDETADAYKIDPGDYIVKIGGSSDSLTLEGTFNLTDAQPKPDLIVSNVKMVPPFPQVGDSVTFIATILNHGTGASPQGTIHEVDFKVNGELICKSTNYINSIPAGGMALVCGNASVNGKNFWTADSKGIYMIEADVNTSNTINEIYTTNNSKTSEVKVAGAPLENIALNKTVQTSSIESNDYQGFNAVDGDMNTRWSSQFSDPQYITIDLGSVKTFNKINLYWETAYGKEYKIYLSDDNSNWTEIYHQTNGVGGSESIIHQSSARYVKIYGIQRGTEWGYSLWEVQIFNDPEITSIKEKNKIANNPKGFILYNNYPNPFNPSTVISYQLPVISNVSLKIFDILGNEVTTLVNKQQQPGDYEILFEADKLRLSSGVYFYQLICGEFMEVKRMVLLK